MLLIELGRWGRATINTFIPLLRLSKNLLRKTDSIGFSVISGTTITIGYRRPRLFMVGFRLFSVFAKAGRFRFQFSENRGFSSVFG